MRALYGAHAMYTLFIRPVDTGIFLLCRLKHIQFLHSVGLAVHALGVPVVFFLGALLQQCSLFNVKRRVV